MHVISASERPPLDLWGVDAAIAPLIGGHRNLAFRTNGLNEELVFKTTRRNEEAITWLGPVLSIAAQSGFVVPELMRSKSGQYVELGWTCERFVAGQPFQPVDLKRLAAPLARFQKASAGVAQRPGFLAARDLLHQDCGGDVDLGRMPSDIVSLCRAAWRGIEHLPVCLVHGDLHAGNMKLTADGGIALLDWDECRVDAGVFDMCQVGLGDAGGMIGRAAMAWEIACSWDAEPNYARGLAARFRNCGIGQA